MIATLLFALSLPRAEAVTNAVILVDRRFHVFAEKDFQLKDVNDGAEAWAKKQDLRFVEVKNGVAIFIPRDFASLDHYEQSSEILSKLSKLDPHGAFNLGESSADLQKAVKNLVGESLGYEPKTSGAEKFCVSYDTTIDMQVGGKTITLTCPTRDMKEYEKDAALQANPMPEDESPQKPPDPNKPKPKAKSPSMEVRIVADKPVFTTERLKLANTATESVAEFVKKQIELNSKAVAAIMDAFGHPEKEALGGTSFSGDKSSLPKKTQDNLREQIMDNWQAHGFSSKQEAENFWQQASVSGTKNNAYLSYAEKSRGGQAPIIGRILLGRE